MRKIILIFVVLLFSLSFASAELFPVNNKLNPNSDIINTSIGASSDPLYNYESNGVLRTFFKSNPTEGQVVKFGLNTSSETMTFQPMALNWVNNIGQLEQISMPLSVVGSPTSSDVFTYPDVYGQGLDLVYVTEVDRLKEKLVIDSFSSLPTPPSYIVDGGTPFIEMNFVFASSSKIIINGVEWDKNSQVSTSSRVEVRDSTTNELLYYFDEPIATDSNGDEVVGDYIFKKSGNSLYVSVRFPYSWLQTAVYPVVLDPTFVVDYSPVPAKHLIYSDVLGDEVFFDSVVDITAGVSDDNIYSTYVTKRYSTDIINYTSWHPDKDTSYDFQLLNDDSVYTAKINLDKIDRAIYFNSTDANYNFTNNTRVTMKFIPEDNLLDKGFIIADSTGTIIYANVDVNGVEDVPQYMTFMLENISTETDELLLYSADGKAEITLDWVKFENLDDELGVAISGFWSQTFDNTSEYFLRIYKTSTEPVTMRAHAVNSETSISPILYVDEALTGSGWYNINVTNLMQDMDTLGLNYSGFRIYPMEDEALISEMMLRRSSEDDFIAPIIANCSINTSNIYHGDYVRLSCDVTDNEDVHEVKGFVNGDNVSFIQNGTGYWYYDYLGVATGNDQSITWNNITASDISGNIASFSPSLSWTIIRSCDYKGTGTWGIFLGFYCEISQAFSNAGNNIMVDSGTTTVFNYDVSNFQNLTISDNSTLRVSNGSTMRLGN